MASGFLEKFLTNLKKDSSIPVQAEIDQALEKHQSGLKLFNLENFSFYHKSISREKAEKLLIDHYHKFRENGCFLLRTNTSVAGDFSLSVINEGTCHHYRIQHAMNTYYTLGDGPLVNGLDVLIRKHQKKQHGMPTSLSTKFIQGELLPMETRTMGIKNLLHETVSEIEKIKKLKLILNSPYCPDVNERDEEGRTALDIACEYDNVEAIKELMKKSPLTNLRALDDYTPLHRAAENNAMHSIDYLLTNTNADPTDRLIDDNFVPLHVAAANNNFMCVKMLLKHHLPDKPRSMENKTPFDIAEEKNYSETMNVLNKYKPPKAKTKSKDWLHESNVTREIAQKILFNAKSEYRDSVFLVRRKGNNQYVLSLMNQSNEFFNYEICTIENGKYYFIDDGPLFNSVENLIEHYMKFNDGLPFKLVNPISVNSNNTSMIMKNIASLPEKIPYAIEKQEKQEDITKQRVNTHVQQNIVAYKQKQKQKKSYKLQAINENDVILESIIGEGEFGCVYKGTLKPGRKVAIKMLKDSKASEEFLREAKIMEKLENHPNIVRIFGIINEKDKCMMVQELMICSLLDKLQELPRVITEYNLKKWAVEIVSGMEHMESKKIVHRDLAARNILLGPNFESKISDFGLSRAYEGDAYTQQTDSKIPIKWYAPESIERCRFTSKSDVWSFGITLWEMWTYGEVPYGDRNGVEVYNFIKIGKRLDRPSKCPSNTYGIMLKCWEWDEDTRISFKGIKGLLETDQEYQSINTIYFDNGVF